MLNRRRLCSWLTGLLLLGWLAPLRAEEPVLVDFDAKVIKAATVKDDQGKKLRLARNEKVTVRYMRGTWCWLQTKKKKSAWVACSTLKPSQPPATETPAPAVAHVDPPARLAADSQPAPQSTPAQAATATVTHTVETASSAPAVAAKPASVEVAADTRAPTGSESAGHRGRDLALRIGAFSALGLGGLALAGAGGLYAWRMVQADQLRQQIVDYNARVTRSEEDRQQLLSERSTIAGYDIGTVATAGGGLLFALTGAILFLVGDDPGRYDN